VSAAGACGRTRRHGGGQAIDLASVGQALTENQLRQMHRLKTGALLRGSVMMGAACREPAGTAHAATEQALSRFGDAIGLAFQVVDDILDVTTDTAILGKTAGKDAAADKPTYVSVLGLARSRDYVQELYAQALAALDASGLDAPSTRALRALAGVVVHRTSKGRGTRT
jgi:farnesyl diphosphate synthase